MKRSYTVVFENGPNNLSVYVPDLPGCVSIGRTLGGARRNIREAITFHIDLLSQHGESIPEPNTSIQEALDLHNEDLAEHYDALGEDIPEPPAIVESVDIVLPNRDNMLNTGCTTADLAMSSGRSR